MQLVDDSKAGHGRLKVVLVAGFFVAALAVPAALYLLRGRKLPLRVAVQASAYVVEPGAEVALTASVDRVPGGGVEPALRWSGVGVRPAGSPARARFVAPREPGSYTVTLHARLSGNKIEDRLTLRVVEGKLDDYRPVRPVRPSPLPPASGEPARCEGGPGLAVEVLGAPCAGGNVVVRLKDPARHGRAAVWHHWRGARGSACAGRVVNLRVPQTGALVLRTLVVEPSGCSREALTAVEPGVGACVGGEAVFADFSAQLSGPGAFRFAAEPPRRPGLRFRYAWDFGDGKRAEGPAPTVAHEYDRARRFRVVRLFVTAGKDRAETVRVIYDRTVAGDDEGEGAGAPPAARRGR